MSTTEPISRLQLEELVIGDLEPARVTAIQVQAETDPELAERLASVRAELAEATRDLPPPPVWSDDAGPPANNTRAWWGVAAVGVAAAASLVVVAGLPSTDPAGSRFKGGLDLKVELVRNGLGVEQFGVVHARSGDRLQYEVTSDVDGVLVVADLQDDGVLSMWQEAVELRAHETYKGAAILDDYEGSERVYLLFDEDGVTEAEVRDAVERSWNQPLAELDTLPLRDEIVQRQIWIVRP